jgi:hypothetical protein
MFTRMVDVAGKSWRNKEHGQRGAAHFAWAGPVVRTSTWQLHDSQHGRGQGGGSAGRPVGTASHSLKAAEASLTAPDKLPLPRICLRRRFFP